MPEIYQPAEDSFFLAEAAKKIISKLLTHNPQLKALDMGSGSGIITETLIGQGINPKNITLVDVNPKAIGHLKKKFKDSTVIKSKLFSKVKGKYDLILFNPPYLPQDKFDSKKDTTGGKKGDETIMKFLNKLEMHLNKNGRILLLTSSLTPRSRIVKIFKRYNVSLLATKKLFYEELYIHEICLPQKHLKANSH